MRLTNKRNDLVKNPLTEPVFYQFWEDANINPPPPETSVRITDDGDRRITNDGDVRITD